MTSCGTSEGITQESPALSSLVSLPSSNLTRPLAQVADLLMRMRVHGYNAACGDLDLVDRRMLAGVQRASCDAGKHLNALSLVVRLQIRLDRAKWSCLYLSQDSSLWAMSVR